MNDLRLNDHKIRFNLEFGVDSNKFIIFPFSQTELVNRLNKAVKEKGGTLEGSCLYVYEEVILNGVRKTCGLVFDHDHFCEVRESFTKIKNSHFEPFLSYNLEGMIDYRSRRSLTLDEASIDYEVTDHASMYNWDLKED